MNHLINQTIKFAKRNASTILTIIGSVGVGATAVLAVKNTPDAIKLVEAAEEEKGDKLTTVEKVKVAWKPYIPAITTGAGTIACIVGANVLNKRSQAAIMSAYTLLDQSYKEYKRKVDEIYGEEAGIHVREEIAKDHYDEEAVIANGDGTELFYDFFSHRYFDSTIEKVQQAEYRLNRQLVMADGASLNDFYDYLGIDHIPSGEEYGWTPGACLDCYWQSWLISRMN